MLRRDVSPYEMFPRLYAPAYYDNMRRVAVCYPIGLHLVVALARWAYYRVTIATYEIESRKDVVQRLDHAIQQHQATLRELDERGKHG